MEEVLDNDVESYPITLTFDINRLGLVSFAGKVRKSKCWKDIVKTNMLLLMQFQEAVLSEFPDTKKILLSVEDFAYLADKVVRSELETLYLVSSSAVEVGTIVLEDK